MNRLATRLGIFNTKNLPGRRNASQYYQSGAFLLNISVKVFDTGHAGESCGAPDIPTRTKNTLAAVSSPVCLTASRTHDYANPVDKTVAFAGEGLAAVMAAKFCKIPWMKPEVSPVQRWGCRWR